MEEEDPALQQMIVADASADGTKNALIQTVRRTSGLQAPIMCLRVSTLCCILSQYCWLTRCVLYRVTKARS